MLETDIVIFMLGSVKASARQLRRKGRGGKKGGTGSLLSPLARILADHLHGRDGSVTTLPDWIPH
jgi:hypothetical protein